MLGEKYYKILGLENSASDSEVKKKFRELAKKYHPDKNPSENSNARFQEIQDAYERIVKRTFEQPSDPKTPNPKSKEQQFQENARKRAEQLKKQEAEDELEFYNSFRFGWRRKCLITIALFGGLCLIGIIIDDFLPLKKTTETVEQFSTKPSKSINDQYVYSVKFKNYPSLWLNYQNINQLDNLPELILAKTVIFHQPVYVFNPSSQIRSDVHFTFYWAQIIIIIFTLLPIVVCFYKRNDLFFILGNYLSLSISAALLLIFLLNDLKIIHLLTLGFY